MDNTNEQQNLQNLQNQINEMNAKSYNNPLLDAKDGFYLTYMYNGQIISDYDLSINFAGSSFSETIVMLSNNYPFFIARHPMEVM